MRPGKGRMLRRENLRRSPSNTSMKQRPPECLMKEEPNGKTRIKIWEVEYAENMSKDWLVANTMDEALAKARQQIEEGTKKKGKKAVTEWRELKEPNIL